MLYRIARLSAALVVLSTPAWSQSLLFNGNSRRERAIEQSGTGVGLGRTSTPVAGGTVSGTTQPQLGTTVGTTVGSTLGTSVGTFRTTNLGSTLQQ